jgi:hypothetical protein
MPLFQNANMVSVLLMLRATTSIQCRLLSAFPVSVINKTRPPKPDFDHATIAHKWKASHERRDRQLTGVDRLDVTRRRANRFGGVLAYCKDTSKTVDDGCADIVNQQTAPIMPPGLDLAFTGLLFRRKNQSKAV